MIAVSPEQEQGTACVLCGRPLTNTASKPVELPDSGRVVRVCAWTCLPTDPDDGE